MIVVSVAVILTACNELVVNFIF